MGSKLLTTCIFCGSDNITTLEWVQNNKLVFCDSCCKSYEPVESVRYNSSRSESLSKDFYSSEDEDEGGWSNFTDVDTEDD